MELTGRILLHYLKPSGQDDLSARSSPLQEPVPKPSTCRNPSPPSQVSRETHCPTAAPGKRSEQMPWFLLQGWKHQTSVGFYGIFSICLLLAWLTSETPPQSSWERVATPAGSSCPFRWSCGSFWFHSGEFPGVWLAGAINVTALIVPAAALVGVSSGRDEPSQTPAGRAGYS